MKKRRSFSAEFKARVALEALSGAHTLTELSAKHNVHPNMIAQWKRRAQENLPELFSKKKDRGEAALEAELKDLHAKIGQRWFGGPCPYRRSCRSGSTSGTFDMARSNFLRFPRFALLARYSSVSRL